MYIVVNGMNIYLGQGTLTVGGRINVWPASSLTRLDLTKVESVLLFVSSEAVESNLFKLEITKPLW